MQCVDNKIRKKIKKTRKTLNEIRKRTNRFQNVSSIKNNKTYNNKNECSDVKAPVYITTNRLTLLHKTIRSETIARSAYTSIAKVYNKVESAEGIVPHKIYETRESVKKYDLKSNEDPILILSTSDNETNCDIQNSLDLFSPIHHIEYDKSSRLSLISESPTALHLQCDSNKYEHFMNSISEYLSKEVPLLLNTDIIEKDKSTLRHMYLESDDFTCTRGIISPNAMEHTDSSREVSSPEIRRSSQSLLSSPDVSLRPALSDSPEYCYYPHRLNQSP